MTRYTTDADIRDMVIETLAAGEGAEDFDVDAIVDELKTVADYDGREFTEVPEGDDFWAIVQRHDAKLASLRSAADAHARLGAAEAEVAGIRAERDDAIRAAIADGTSMYAIAQEVGITQQAVARIRDRG